MHKYKIINNKTIKPENQWKQKKIAGNNEMIYFSLQQFLVINVNSVVYQGCHMMKESCIVDVIFK